MKKSKVFMYSMVIFSLLVFSFSGCSRSNESSQAIEFAEQDDYVNQSIHHVVNLDDDMYIAAGYSNREIAVIDSWPYAYQYKPVITLTLSADNVFVSGVGIKIPEDVLSDDIYGINVMHMGDIDSVMTLGIWGSIEEVNNLLFSNVENYPILLVLEIISSANDVIGHSLTNSRIYNAITHECYTAAFDDVIWYSVWPPTDADVRCPNTADESGSFEYKIKLFASLYLRADNAFASGRIAILPDGLLPDDIYDVSVKHIGDMNSLMDLDICETVAEVENLLLQDANTSPIYVVLEFTNSDGDIVGHSLIYSPIIFDTTFEWHTAVIEEITWGMVWDTPYINSWRNFVSELSPGVVLHEFYESKPLL